MSAGTGSWERQKYGTCLYTSYDILHIKQMYKGIVEITSGLLSSNLEEPKEE